MKLTDVIAYCDRIKPNAFSDEVKAGWVSEAEGLVYTEIFLLMPGEFRPFVLSDTYSAAGMCFPEADLIRLKSPVPDGFRADGLLKLTVDQTSETSLYAENSGTAKYRILSISADGCEIRLDASFPDTGREEDPASWTLDFDGTGVEVAVRPPHDKLYAAYLTAMIDFANGEYNKYQNSMQLFNLAFGEFARWYSHPGNTSRASRNTARSAWAHRSQPTTASATSPAPSTPTFTNRIMWLWWTNPCLPPSM